MKNCLFFILMIIAVSSHAQNVTISCNSANLLYTGMENTVDIGVSNYDCDSISVSTDNGELKKNAGCSYVIRLKNDKQVNLSISAIKNGETIAIKKIAFDVYPLPDPAAKICGIDGFDIKPAL